MLYLGKMKEPDVFRVFTLFQEKVNFQLPGFEVSVDEKEKKFL